MFDNESSSISHLYRDFKCEHYLIQERPNERPKLPGLTSVGFERWVTLFVKAYPNAEFKRLQNALHEMAINNPDNKEERFPKEIPRRLFPVQGDLDIQLLIKRWMEENISMKIEDPRPLSSAPQGHRPSVRFAEPEAYGR